MYVPSNIIKLPNVFLIPDSLSSGGAGTKVVFSNASIDANWKYFDLELNTNWSLDVTNTVITVTKKTLVRSVMRQVSVTDNQRFQSGIFDNSNDLQLGKQGGWHIANSNFGGSLAWPNGINLAHLHNSADAIVDANTSFYIKITLVTPSGGGIRYYASSLALFQLED